MQLHTYYLVSLESYFSMIVHIFTYTLYMALSSYLVFVAIRIGAKWERLQPGAVEQKT